MSGQHASAEDPCGVSHDIIASLHLAITSAQHPDCVACAALLPVLATYLAATGVTLPA